MKWVDQPLREPQIERLTLSQEPPGGPVRPGECYMIGDAIVIVLEVDGLDLVVERMP